MHLHTKGVAMADLYIERRSLLRGSSLSWDLAHHMYTRQSLGPMIVLAEEPAGMLSGVKKQWLTLGRQVQRERAATLKSRRIQELTREVGHMQRLRFTTKSPNDTPVADGVYFFTVEQALVLQPSCQTLYITGVINENTQATIVRGMPKHALVVVYT